MNSPGIMSIWSLQIMINFDQSVVHELQSNNSTTNESYWETKLWFKKKKNQYTWKPLFNNHCLHCTLRHNVI